MLVLDEVQTGLGRLGRWWGADRDGITPDVLLAGKTLSGGVVPVAAMIATAEAYEPFNRDPFLHTSTFAGSPLATAAAAATVRVLAEEDLVGRAASLGARILTELRTVATRHCPDLVTEVRGEGLLIGLEMAEPVLAGELLLDLLDQGLLANHSLNADTVIRLTPPAVMTDRDTDRLLSTLDTALARLGQR